jgi:DNA repair exonuclease SbcCD ATPase subunit
MQEDLISTFYDLNKITEHTDIVLKQLNDVLSSVKRIENAKITLSGSKSIREVADATRVYKKEQDELLKIQGEIDKAYKKRMAAETDLGKILAEEKELLRQVTAEQKNLLREQNAAAGSLEQMRAQLIRLNKEYDNLSEADRRAATGLQLKDKISGLSTELKALEGDTGRFQRNVGNYGNSFKGALGTLESELTKIRNKLNDPGGLGAAQLEKLTKQEQALADITKNLGANFSSTTAQSNAYKEAAVQLGLVYGQNHEVFKSFSKQVGTGAQELSSLKKNVTDSSAAGDKAGGTFGKLYSIFRQIANVVPGLGLSGLILLLITPLSALAETVIKYTKSAFGAAKANEDLRKSYEETKRLVHESSKEYQDAVKTVNELKINIGLAKDGFLDKQRVLNEYNSTIGKTTGQVKTLDEAEQALTKNGDAYIKMMLYKAAANLALQEAAKKAFEAEETRLKQLDEFKNELTENRVSSGGAGGLGTGQFDPKEYDRETKRIQFAQRKRREQLYLDQQAAAQKEVDIAKKFQADAAKLASEFHFDFFNGGEDGKKTKEKKDNQLNKDLIAEFQTIKAAKERLAALYLDSAQDENVAYNLRIMNLGQYLKIRQELVAEEGDLELKTQELSAKEKIAVERKVDDEQIKLAQESSKILYKIQDDYLKELAKVNGQVEDQYSSSYKKLHGLLDDYLKKRGEAEAKANKKEEEDTKKTKERLIKELESELSNLTFDLLEGTLDREKNAIQEQIDALEKKKQKDIEVATQSIANAQDRAAAITTIEARAAAQKEALERRQRELDERKAKFEKARAIADIIQNTAAQIVEHVGNPVLVALIAAIGAAQLARVIATPIPKYFKGKNVDDFYEGPAWVGDGGKSEAIIRENGNIEITPDTPTLTHVGRKDIILPDARMLAAAATRQRMDYLAGLESRNRDNQLDQLSGDVRQIGKNIVKAIKSQPAPKAALIRTMS